jgi:putative ABC transport system permease protein
LNPTNDLQGTISKLRNIFRTADVLAPFDYHFIDEDFDRKFHDEQFIGLLATFFGCLAIFISCLGLFGLSAFMAEQRKKEVGLRKVLGASVSSIFTLLSKDFLMLVILSLVIAFPIAYWIMHDWLQNFDYRIGISWYIFVGAALLALLIAFVTVSFQAVRAARANPVRSLRVE